MFDVPETDSRLLNKDEILAMRSGEEQLAISTEFLQENTVYHDAIAGTKFVVLTDATGANRVYEAGEVVFESWDQNEVVTDSNGQQWKASASSLSDGKTTLARLPAHRAFWFGWFAQFPETRLVGGGSGID